MGLAGFAAKCSASSLVRNQARFVPLRLRQVSRSKDFQAVDPHAAKEDSEAEEIDE
jgi:hypothetical protein